MAVHTAFQMAGLPPKMYGVPPKILGNGRTRRRQGLSNRLTAMEGEMRRRQGLLGGKARAALKAQSESPLNVNPIQPLPGTSVISVPPTIAAGQIHKIEPVQLKFTTGQRWMGVALLAVVAFSLFRK